MHPLKRNNLKIVLIGISGSGKTTLGKMLAKYFKISFIEGDNFHSIKSKKKMKEGNSLNFQDRLIWHKKIQKKINLNNKWVLSCSALGVWQREILSKKNQNLNFFHCSCSKEIIKKRLGLRVGHFFSPHLLDSQIESFEEPKEIPTIETSNCKSNCLKRICKILKKNESSESNNRSDLSRL
ncbi:MAG: hypothetical protein CBD16_08515 [Betaproteobacteria bacterium TMED156]|nr:MAG: hypothetical protein CBD16_08515 [Betaproteobacteria bacterium TMED156]